MGSWCSRASHWPTPRRCTCQAATSRRRASTRSHGTATGRDGGSRGEDPRLARLAPEQRRVVDALREGPKSIRELAEALNPGHLVSGPNRDPKYKAVSEIVYKLRGKGLVEQRAFDRRWGLLSLSSTTTGTEGRNRCGGTIGTTGTAGTAGTTENVSSCSSSSCPRCAGESCDWCGGIGRVVDDEPETRA